jgi:hypothetical protein
MGGFGCSRDFSRGSPRSPLQFFQKPAISWCPEAKFERDGGGLSIGSHEGSRHVLGLLLMTLGLVEAARRAHPREWVVFLNRSQYEPLIQPWVQATLDHTPCQARGQNLGEVYYSADIPQLPEVWIHGETEAACRQNLEAELFNRGLLRLARGEALPQPG